MQMECLFRLETFLNSTVFLFISYWIIQNGISICRLKIVLNSVKKNCCYCHKVKINFAFGWSFNFFVEVVAKYRQCYNTHLVGFLVQVSNEIANETLRLESLSIWLWMFLKFCRNGKHPRSQWLKWLFLHVIFRRMLDAFSRCLGM